MSSQAEHQQPAPKKPRLVFTDLQRRTLQAIFKVSPPSARTLNFVQRGILLTLGEGFAKAVAFSPVARLPRPRLFFRAQMIRGAATSRAFLRLQLAGQ